MHTDKDIEYLNLDPDIRHAVDVVQRYRRVERGVTIFGDKLTNGVELNGLDRLAQVTYAVMVLCCICGFLAVYSFMWYLFPLIMFLLHAMLFVIWVGVRLKDIEDRRQSNRKFEEKVKDQYNALSEDQKRQAYDFLNH